MTIKQHTSNYYLDIKFGEVAGKTKAKSNRLNTQVNVIDSLVIVQDINRMLPSFRLKFIDPTTEYTQLAPFDNSLSRIRISFNRNKYPENPATFDFDTYRVFPTSEFLFDAEGFIQIENLFSPEKIRGFSNSISVKTHLETIAFNDLKVDRVEISGSLENAYQSILQSDISNDELFTYLKNNLLGTRNEAAYFCYIKQDKLERVFVFKSLRELYLQKPKYYFTDSTHAFGSATAGKVYYPILDHKAFDNRNLFGKLGVRGIDYTYFDYETTEFKYNRINTKDNDLQEDDFLSLTHYLAIDSGDEDVGLSITNNGRTPTSRSDFKGNIKNELHKRLNDLSRFWITSWGIEDVSVGDVVSTEFAASPSLLGLHQYNGSWLVERVIHMLGANFGTRLLLSRCGINTSEKTTLVKVSDKNKAIA